MTFRPIGDTFRCVPIQRRELFCLRVFTKWNKSLMGLICQEALHARPLAVRLYTHSLLEMNFGSYKGDDNNRKASALPSFCLSLSALFFPVLLSVVLISLMQRGRKCILVFTFKVSSCTFCTLSMYDGSREREKSCVYKRARKRDAALT